MSSSDRQGGPHRLRFRRRYSRARVPAVRSESPRSSAVASPTGKASAFARKGGIPHAFEDYRELLALPDIDLITLAFPTTCTAESYSNAAAAGKHVVCEKPLCRTLEEADRMIAACGQAGVLLLYAEELLFRPEIRAAPSSWWTRARWAGLSGQAVGGARRAARALVLGREPLRRRRAARHGLPLHRVRPLGLRQAAGQERLRHTWAPTSTATRRRARTTAIVHRRVRGRPDRRWPRTRWAKPGGVDDRCEIYGSTGHTRADLLRGNALRTYSEAGYGYAVEKAAIRRAGPSRCSRRSGTTASRRNCRRPVDRLGKEEPSETGGERW